jgi:DNA-binding NtrC family response regulator
MAKCTLLLLDDRPGAAPTLETHLAAAGCPATRVSDPGEALALLADLAAPILFIHSHACLDLVPFIHQVAQLRERLPVVVLSSSPSVREAVAVARAGAINYAESEAAAVRFVQDLVGSRAAGLASRQSGSATGRVGGLADLVGASQEMQKVFELIKKVTDTDTTVLIQGESGTGKELIARALHTEGQRHNAPFVPVNCGAIPGELLESELFGHEKGAFTHAVRTRIGRFELANGGTVFLDEIGEMSPMLQVKLLRVLQERQFERVGGTRTISSDFRVIAATNRDLEHDVATGRFREDLFYRLNVIQIEAPPLRQKVEDIPLLADHFIAKFNRTKKRRVSGFTPEAMAVLRTYAWPGNVRELENVVERLLILAPGNRIGVEDLPERFLAVGPAPASDAVHMSGDGLCLSDVVTQFEKGIIEQALNRTGWVKNRAAKLLQVNRTTLIEKMKRYQMVRPGSDEG